MPRLTCDRLARLAWFVLLVVHVPALVGSIDRFRIDPHDPALATTMVAVCAAVALFALKLADVRFLRLGARRTACVAWLAIAGIVHHEALSTALPEPALPTALVCATAGSAIATEGGRLIPRLRRVLRSFCASPLAPHARAFPTRGDHPLVASIRRASLRLAAPRGPPSILGPA